MLNLMLSLSLLSSGAVTRSVIVNTTAGVVQGVASDQGVHVFRGIPFGAPPVGRLRWQAPEAAAAWTGVRDATKDGPGCPQHCQLPRGTCPTIMDEDCLVLNVFAPENSTRAPVLFFIHGGDFVQGYVGGHLYDGTHFAREHGVVVVAAQYRLGALGFLYSGDDSSQQFTGNFALLDQQLALEWLQKNARSFGADASQVTIFGQSAGAMSVASHLVMKSSESLFARAVMQSDPLALPFRTTSTYPKFTAVVARKAGCAHRLQTAGYEACMRTLPWQSVVNAQLAAQKDLAVERGHVLDLFVPFSPVVGVAEFPVTPIQSIIDGSMHDKPLIIGSVHDEGLLFAYQAFPTGETQVIEDAVLDVSFGVRNGHRILERYPRSALAKSMNDMRNHTGNWSTDSLFHCSIRHSALLLANGTTPRKSSTWIYHFDQVPSFGVQGWTPGFEECIPAVCHSAELPYLFHSDAFLAALNASFTSQELKLSTAMNAYWANFATTGIPGAPRLQPEWPPFTAAEASMIFKAETADVSTVVEEVYRAKCEFWDGIGYIWSG